MLNKFAKQYPGLTGIASISGATLFGQLALLLATPVLSRIYSAQEFGTYSALIAMVSIISSVSALKFDSAIILPYRDEVASTLLKISIMCSLIISLISGLIFWIVADSNFGESFNQIPLFPLWIAALSFMSSLGTMMVQISLRAQIYRPVAMRSALQSAATALVQTIAGLFSQTSTSLLWGVFWGNLAGFVPLSRHTILLVLSEGEKWKRTIVTYWRMPIILAPAALLNTVGAQLPIFILISIFGAAVAGEFAMAQRMIFIPATLITASVAQVFSAELAQYMRSGGNNSRNYYLRVSAWLTLGAIPVSIATVLIGEWFFPIFLGPDWNAISQYCLPLSLLMGFSLVVSPTSQVYIIFQSYATLVMDFLRIACMVGGYVIIVSLKLSAVDAIWTLTLAQLIAYIISWLFGIRITTKNISHGIDT